MNRTDRERIVAKAQVLNSLFVIFLEEDDKEGLDAPTAVANLMAITLGSLAFHLLRHRRREIPPGKWIDEAVTSASDLLRSYFIDNIKE